MNTIKKILLVKFLVLITLLLSNCVENPVSSGFLPKHVYDVDGSLFVTSNPDNAKVFIDNVYKGVTTTEEYRGLKGLRIKLKLGKHILKVEKDGYQKYEEEIFLGVWYMPMLKDIQLIKNP